MNIDTDMQWAFWEGIKNYYESKKVTCKRKLATPTVRMPLTKSITIHVYGFARVKNQSLPASKRPLPILMQLVVVNGSKNITILGLILSPKRLFLICLGLSRVIPSDSPFYMLQFDFKNQ